MLIAGSARRRTGLVGAVDPTNIWPEVDPLAASDVQGTPYNTAPQTTPTYDGSGQAIHPAVLDFRSDWNGYRYWMAMTPYPGQNIQLENPSILVSDDGIAWEVPDGLTNPIYPWQGPPGYNSDPELVYDPSTGRLICYWRTVVSDSSQTSHTLAKWSTNGTTWSDVVPIIEDQHFHDCVSPSVIRRGEGDWWMFAISAVPGDSGVATYRSTDPLTGWGGRSVTTIGHLWHAGAAWDGDAFRLLSCNGDGSLMVAHSSTDGYAWSSSGTLMVGRSGQWDEKLYRPSLVIRDDTWMRVWYSAYSGSGGGTVWRTAGTQIPRSAWPAPPT